jgi:hypothetical protein
VHPQDDGSKARKGQRSSLGWRSTVPAFNVRKKLCSRDHSYTIPILPTGDTYQGGELEVMEQALNKVRRVLRRGTQIWGGDNIVPVR